MHSWLAMSVKQGPALVSILLSVEIGIKIKYLQLAYGLLSPDFETPSFFKIDGHMCTSLSFLKYSFYSNCVY